MARYSVQAILEIEMSQTGRRPSEARQAEGEIARILSATITELLARDEALRAPRAAARGGITKVQLYDGDDAQQVTLGAFDGEADEILRDPGLLHVAEPSAE